jgi:type I restriction enzyme M protein
MLTSEIKQKIDSARNILVGKIPTPTGQVEQITLALVYKFMNDIDEQNKELGGTLKFFIGDYQKYAWKNLLDKSLSAYERVTAYGEGLEKMHLNPNLPQFFRNVFRGAFLPFRDPEVLTIFLKQIDEFQYGVNGDLGDAFEYLLQVMGTQGDAGQFLTPRHHINFIVSVVDPQKTDKTLDPAEGTAGFLISAYLHILRQNTKPGSDLLGSALTYDERKKLSENFVGYDISHDMVRLSLVNLYLHGFADPRIYEYDTLGNLDRWDDDFDCILTNPPFMTPKGGVKPHKRFSIQAKRSEVLFVDYIMEHLNPNGKAGIIVPEGIIFQSATAYKALRKMMIDQNFLYAVVSLPAGIFQPYSGVKTSILFMDRVIAKKTKDILFVKVENDGFDLGAQRRPIDKNDLPAATEILKRYKMSIQTGEPFELSEDDKMMASLIPIEKIGKSGDYNLSGDRYKETIALINQKWPMVELGEVTEVISGQSPEGNFYNDKGEGTPFYQGKSDYGEMFLREPTKWTTQITKIAEINDIVMSVRAPVGPVNITPIRICIGRGLAAIRPKNKLSYLYLYYMLRETEENIKAFSSGSTFESVNRSHISQLKIPLPPLEVQQEIVLQLDSYQKIIDGAKQVVDNYKPEIKIDPNWELKSLGDMCELISGQHIMSEDYNENGEGTPYLTGPFDFGTINPIISKWTTRPKVIARQGDILITVKGSGIGKLNILSIPEVSISRQLMAIRSTILNSSFLYTILFDLYDHFQKEGVGAAIPGLDRNDILSLKIPLPPLDIQKQIVSRIEEEQQLVDATKKLIGIYQGKIKEKIDEVWGE